MLTWKSRGGYINNKLTLSSVFETQHNVLVRRIRVVCMYSVLMFVVRRRRKAAS